MQRITIFLVLLAVTAAFSQTASARYLQADPIGIAEDFSDPQMQVAIQLGMQIRRTNSYPAFHLNHLYGYVNQNPLSYIDPYGLQSDKAAVTSAIARGDIAQLRNLLPSLSPELSALAEAGIVRLGSTAETVIANECKGSIRRVFRTELLGTSLSRINQLARAGDKPAKTAKKLLNDKRFKK